MSNYSIMHWSSLSHNLSEVLNFSGHKHAGSLLEGFTQTQISTLAVRKNFLVAGGFEGELACKEALFGFCCPELLGDKKWFKKKYENAILRGNDKNAFDRDKRIGSAVAKELRERIQPYFLCRLKSEVFCNDDGTNTTNLSQKHEIIVWLRLTTCQRQLYKAFLKSELVVSAFDGSPLAALTVKYVVMDMQQVDVYKEAIGEYRAASFARMSKSSTVKSNNVALPRRQINNYFVQFRKIANHPLLVRRIYNDEDVVRFAKKLHPRGVFGFECTLERVIEELKSYNDFSIHQMSTRAGGQGLNLTEADTVIIHDMDFNLQIDRQA